MEWAATSPPEPYNFLYLPTVRSRTPLWSDEDAPLVVGLSAKEREVLVTTLLDAEPDHKYELAKDSLWPLLLAIVVAGTFTGLIFDPIYVPIGAVLSILIFFGWFWKGNFPEPEEEQKDEEPSPQPGHAALHQPSSPVTDTPSGQDAATRPRP